MEGFFSSRLLVCMPVGACCRNWLPRRSIEHDRRSHFRASPEPFVQCPDQMLCARVGKYRPLHRTGSSSSRRRRRRPSSSPRNSYQSSNRASDQERFTFALPWLELPRCREPQLRKQLTLPLRWSCSSIRVGWNETFATRIGHCNRVATVPANHFRRYHTRQSIAVT
ncbi:hypothetical protein LY76DRAFT_216624 [Colletotrichum caudatum]|nr:hypothetical protein LY76DRAFT_216624 [Colletotrichum caudatum]